jgi:hypothetical protein
VELAVLRPLDGVRRVLPASVALPEVPPRTGVAAVRPTPFGLPARELGGAVCRRSALDAVFGAACFAGAARAPDAAVLPAPRGPVELAVLRPLDGVRRVLAASVALAEAPPRVGVAAVRPVPEREAGAACFAAPAFALPLDFALVAALPSAAPGPEAFVVAGLAVPRVPVGARRVCSVLSLSRGVLDMDRLLRITGVPVCSRIGRIT